MWRYVTQAFHQKIARCKIFASHLFALIYVMHSIFKLKHIIVSTKGSWNKSVKSIFIVCRKNAKLRKLYKPWQINKFNGEIKRSLYIILHACSTNFSHYKLNYHIGTKNFFIVWYLQTRLIKMLLISVTLQLLIG